MTGAHCDSSRVEADREFLSAVHPAFRSGQPPPGIWRLLAPALLAWALSAFAVVRPGTGRWLLLGGAALGVVVVCGELFAGLRDARRKREHDRRQPPDSAHRALGKPTARARTPRYLAGPVVISCALVALLGARIDHGETVRSDATLEAQAERTTARSYEVILRGYPTTGDGATWIVASVRGANGWVPIVLWCGNDAFDTRAETARSVTGAMSTAAPPPSGSPSGSAPEPEHERDVCAPEWGPGVAMVVRGTLVKLEAGSSSAFGVRVSAARSRSSGGAASTGAAGLRTGLRAAAAQISGAELVPGLAVGDTALVDQHTDAQMRNASLTHMVAVSGANCALVTSSLGWVVARCGAGRRIRVLVQATALMVFVYIVGPDPSVQRAAVMAAVILLSGYGGKRSVALPALACAIIALLVHDPWQSLHPGFALSVAATGGILLAVPAFTRALARWMRVPRWAILPIAVAAAAQMACAPLLVLIQPGLPAVGVLANVVAAPAAPFGTGLGLVALITLPIAPNLGAWCTQLAGVAGQWIVGTAAVTSALPYARWPWPGGWPGALLLAGVEVALGIAWWLFSSRVSRSARGRPWGSATTASKSAVRWTLGLAAAGVGTLLGPTVVAPTTARTAVPQDWSVVACDVGQGDAVLARDPERPSEVLLVDTGDDAEALLGCLERFRVDRITLLVISHDHQDHFGALSAVSSRVDRALVAPENREGGRTRPLLEELGRAGIPVDIARGGARGTVGAGMPWRILGPSGERVPPNANAASVVMSVRVGAFTVLFLGDTGEESQTELLRSAGELRADIVKVAHHGSRDQAPALPARVRAELGLISVGLDNRYGHPTTETLAELRSAGTRPARTDELGSIAVSGEPGRLRVWGTSPRAPSESASVVRSD
ncbi:competence protein ComEC [Leucobacter luti]|uniref:Competence protein ComEC n=1 Tax=Leucobacter luti TaxID=340320 RepID=A0A4R6RTN9_9MICO|nr:ComEC/Rec2 family competence protein [Leucobacter luti]TDP90232.1 competence protein ComEC [Leucobacter luti]